MCTGGGKSPEITNCASQSSSHVVTGSPDTDHVRPSLQSSAGDHFSRRTTNHFFFQGRKVFNIFVCLSISVALQSYAKAEVSGESGWESFSWTRNHTAQDEKGPEFPIFLLGLRGSFFFFFVCLFLIGIRGIWEKGKGCIRKRF